MGCGQPGNNGREEINKKSRPIEDVDLYREAFGCDLKIVNGFQITNDNRKSQPNVRVLNKKYTKIKEEIMDHYEESDAIKPWLSQIAVSLIKFIY